MKKIILISLALFAFFIYSCSKNSEDGFTPNPTPGPGGNTCDTANMEYQADVVPILEANCYSCHGETTNTGSNGIILEGHSNLLPRVTSGVLVGAITHAPGFTPMPFEGTKLSACNINKIISWVNNGALNN